MTPLEASWRVGPLVLGLRAYLQGDGVRSVAVSALLGQGRGLTVRVRV